MLSRRIRFVAALAGALVSVTPALQAQVGRTTDIVTGRITTTTGAPVAGAVVVVTGVASQVSRTLTTHADGRYTALVPDGGGDYTIDVRALGLTPGYARVHRIALEDRLVADVTLAPAANILDRVVITADSSRPSAGTGRTFSSDDLRNFGLEPNNVAGAAALVPGVMIDSGGGISINGQSSSSSTITVDGLVGNAGALPPEAIGTVSVVAHDFDVASRSSGVQVAVTTQGGTNVPHGSLFAETHDRALEIGAPPIAINGFQTSATVHGGYGGPLIHDRLFLFGAGSANFSATTASSLLDADPATLAAAGLSPDSAQRVLAILRAQGVPTSPPSGATGTSIQENENLFARLDALPSPGQTVTLDLQLQHSTRPPGAVGLFALPTIGASTATTAGGVQLSLTSTLPHGMLNQLKGGINASRATTTPLVALPSASVLVASDAFASVAFGGSGSAPSSSETSTLQLADELSWLSPGGGHRVKLGVSLTSASASQSAGSNALGSYSYTSLADLAAGVPASFSRTLYAPTIRSGALNASMYAGDTWEPTRAFQLSYGLRVDAAHPDALPPYDPAIDSVFHRRTDQLPAGLAWDPSIGAQWIIGSARTSSGRPPLAVLHGGIRSSQSFAPGTQGAKTGPPQIQLSCSGATVPAPSWGAYTPDSTCTDGTLGSPSDTGLAGIRPTVTVYDPHATAPHTWTAAVGSEVPLSRRVRLTFDLSGSAGDHQPGLTDLNLVRAPQFLLANEGNRPVFAPPSAIDPATGTVSPLGSRLYPAFGQVLSYTTSLHSLGGTAAAGLTATGANGRSLVLSYSIAGARDQAFYPTPLQATWGRGASDGAQQIAVAVAWPIGRSASISLLSIAHGGMRYTPSVNADVTGAGLGQTPAFVFDPAIAATRGDTAVASGMRNLLAHASGSVRGCLSSELNQLAMRNACVGPWQATVGGQFRLKPDWWGLDHRLTLSLGVSNMLAGLDVLVHGTNHLAGWGASGSPDPTLLYVEGFNAATNSFQYAVNPRFGSTATARVLQQAPSQLTAQLQLEIGPRAARH